MADSVLSYLEEIETLVVEDSSVVTYKTVAHKFGVPSDVAKKMLFAFAKKQANKISVLYYISGKLKKTSNLVHQLVSAEKLEEMKKKFNPILSLHVYSVQMNLPKDSSQIWIPEKIEYSKMKSIKEVDQFFQRSKSGIYFEDSQIDEEESSSNVSLESGRKSSSTPPPLVSCVPSSGELSSSLTQVKTEPTKKKTKKVSPKKKPTGKNQQEAQESSSRTMSSFFLPKGPTNGEEKPILKTQPKNIIHDSEEEEHKEKEGAISKPKKTKKTEKKENSTVTPKKKVQKENRNPLQEDTKTPAKAQESSKKTSPKSKIEFLLNNEEENEQENNVTKKKSKKGASIVSDDKKKKKRIKKKKKSEEEENLDDILSIDGKDQNDDMDVDNSPNKKSKKKSPKKSRKSKVDVLSYDSEEPQNGEENSEKASPRKKTKRKMEDDDDAPAKKRKTVPEQSNTLDSMHYSTPLKSGVKTKRIKRIKKYKNSKGYMVSEEVFEDVPISDEDVDEQKQISPKKAVVKNEKDSSTAANKKNLQTQTDILSFFRKN